MVRNRPVRKPAAERAVGDEADAQLPAERQHLVLGVAGPERVLGLERGDRVLPLRPADGLGRGLREARDSAPFPGRTSSRHRADGLLDRHGVVHPVLVVEVDVVHAEPPERVVAGLADVVGPAVHAEIGAVLRALVAELGGEDHLVAAAADRPADEPLVGEGTVHVGRVEEVRCRGRGRGGSWRWTRRRRGRRRSRTSPCSRARGRRR